MNNCGLEAHNGILKSYTGSSASLPVFVQQAFNYLREQSLMRDPAVPDAISFSLLPTCSGKWADANYLKAQTALPLNQAEFHIHQTAQSEPSYVVLSREHHSTYFTGGDDHRATLVATIVTKYRTNGWSDMYELNKFLTVDNFVLKLHGEWYCHCEQHTCDFARVHILGVRILTGELDIPPVASSFSVSKRKRGRAKSTNKFTTAANNMSQVIVSVPSGSTDVEAAVAQQQLPQDRDHSEELPQDRDHSEELPQDRG